MIILDTNVLSALMQQRTEPAVVDWLDRQAAESVWMTSVTVFEARYGLALLADGRRKASLQKRLNELVAIDLENRILVFDTQAAEHAAQLAAERRARGRPVDIRDTFIGAIAMAHGATLATRNVKHFENLSIPVVNPWNAEP